MDASRRMFVKAALVGAAGVPLLPSRLAAQQIEQWSQVQHAADPARLSASERRHAPVLTLPARVRAGRPFDLGISVGTELHESTAEHHIEWIEVRVGTARAARFELVPLAGESTVMPVVHVTLKLSASAPIRVLAMCNLHGLWETVRPVAVS